MHSGSTALNRRKVLEAQRFSGPAPELKLDSGLHTPCNAFHRSGIDAKNPPRMALSSMQLPTSVLNHCLLPKFSWSGNRVFNIRGLASELGQLKGVTGLAPPETNPKGQRFLRGGFLPKEAVALWAIPDCPLWPPSLSFK